MSHVIVTGAAGFVGYVLAQRLLRDGLNGTSVRKLTLLDVAFAKAPQDARINQRAGSIADAVFRDAAFAEPVDAVFHLASIPGGAAEKNIELGRAVNLDATIGMLEVLRTQPKPPRFVFASTIAVYGATGSAPMSEDTAPAPNLSYAAQKLMGEVALADATRRGWVRGCALRLPGVVARPGDGAGMISAFMSQLFWKLAAGEPITLPVSADGTAWWISAGACVDNLLHAASADLPQVVYQMPVLHLRIADVIDALAARFGADRNALVSFAPDAFVQANFAAYPPLATPRALAAGFIHDGVAENLVTSALQTKGNEP